MKSCKKSMADRMAHFIFFSFFIFLLNIPLFSFAKSNPAGTLYFPLAWEIESERNITPADISQGTITFQNTQTGSKVSYPLETKTVITKQEKKMVVFLGKKTVNLLPDSYDSVLFSAVYRESGSANPIVLNANHRIHFNVVNNKTTVLGGILVRSSIHTKTKQIDSLSTIYLNKFSLDYNDLVSGTLNLNKNKINFLNSTSPVLVQRLPNKNRDSGKQAHYGFVMDMPCNFSGVSAISFFYNNDPVAYYQPIPAYPKACFKQGEQNQDIVNIFLQQGTWKIHSISQLSSNQLDALGYAEINTPQLLKYFKTDSEKFLRHNSYSKLINRNLSFVVKNDYPSKQFFYMGAFEWKLNENNGDFADVVFKRNFSLRDIRRFFREHQIFNGFTGERILHDKILGIISVLLQDINVSAVSKSDLAQLQKAFLADISNCVQNGEQDNPLLAVDGSILLHNDENNKNAHQAELKFVEKSESVAKFKACLTKQFADPTLPSMNVPFVVEAVVSSL